MKQMYVRIEIIENDRIVNWYYLQGINEDGDILINDMKHNDDDDILRDMKRMINMYI